MQLSPSIKILLNKIWWLAFDMATSVYDWMLYWLRIPVKSFKANAYSKVLVYVGEFLPPRIARIAKWSKRLDKFTTVLVCHKRGFVEKFSNNDIDHLILFRNKWHLKRIAKSIPNPYIVHGFAPKSKYTSIAMQAWRNAIHHPPSTIHQPPFIMDYQDVFAVYYGITPKFPWLKEELPYEKACLTEADGIVANSLEPCEGMKIWGIKQHCPRMFFPLYADNDYFISGQSSVVSGQSSLTTDDCSLTTDLHLVYAGGVNGSHRDKVHYGITQFHWLIDYLTEQKIHFHIYPSPSVIKADYEEYEQIAKNSTYFHYHSPVSQSKLPEELSKYHYGLMPFFVGSSGQSDLKFRYGTTLKLFNYLEAGIPILSSADAIYQSWLVNRYSLGKVADKKEDFKDVRKLVGDTPYNEQVKKVFENREILSLKKHTPRLLEFYKKLHENMNDKP